MDTIPPQKGQQKGSNSLDQPVAYDAEGQPLYARPQPTTQVVHVARSLEPEQPIVSAETKKLHDRSMRLYPDLNLSEGEYIISAVGRHSIGVVAPLALGAFLIGIAFSLLFNYDYIVSAFNITGALANVGAIVAPVLIFSTIVVIGMAISYYVYTQNRFYLTNESVIQEIQNSLFSRQEQTVSLGNVEDASFTQTGILQQIFDYGNIRLSTEGDETTYRFSYVAHPKVHIARLNNAVEAFKNGRPVEYH